MQKSDLLEKLTIQNTTFTTLDSKIALDSLIDHLSNLLSEKQRIEIRGFGAFSVQHRKQRTGRNPRTGETVNVEEKYIPRFKTGKELRLKLNKQENSSNES